MIQLRVNQELHHRLKKYGTESFTYYDGYRLTEKSVSTRLMLEEPRVYNLTHTVESFNNKFSICKKEDNHQSVPKREKTIIGLENEIHSKSRSTSFLLTESIHQKSWYKTRKIYVPAA